MPGLLWALWFWKWYRDDPSQHREVNAAELALLEGSKPTSSGTQATPWIELASSPAMWLICGQQFFRAAGYMFFTSWFATYLQEAKGVTIVHSGFLNMLPLLAVLGGNLVGGQFSDMVLQRTGSRRLARQGVSVVSMLLCAVFTFSAYLFSDALIAVIIISIGSFCASLAAPSGYAITIDMGGEHVAAVNSVMNMCGNFGAMLFPLVVPHLLKQTGSWDAVLVSFGCLYIVAMLCWWLIKPDGTVFDQALIRSSSKSDTK